MNLKISAFKSTFWDLWIQKIFRNIASVKYQWLFFLYVPVIWGMYNINEKTGQPWITAALGLGFLGGGFLTLATSRMIYQSRLTEEAPEELVEEDKPSKEEIKGLDTDR